MTRVSPRCRPPAPRLASAADADKPAAQAALDQVTADRQAKLDAMNVANAAVAEARQLVIAARAAYDDVSLPPVTLPD
jgi:hypothetical protein